MLTTDKVENKSIMVKRVTHKLLTEMKRGDESYDEVIIRLYDSYLVNENPNLSKWQKESLKRMRAIQDDDYDE